MGVDGIEGWSAEPIAAAFQAFPKIPRWKRELVVTEKIDGTNAQVMIVPAADAGNDPYLVAEAGGLALFAGSRNRFVTPASSKTDNFGFAAWVKENAAALIGLGVGRHYGEWWGRGIGRGYGQAERLFSLFNVQRWGTHNPSTPWCCRVVPILYRGEWIGGVDAALQHLRESGSSAAPGWRTPEGVVIFHSASGGLFKRTLDQDDAPKSAARSAKEPALA